MTRSTNVIGNVVTCNCGKLEFHLLVVKIILYGVLDRTKCGQMRLLALWQMARNKIAT
jgi:hypothetical protein